MIFRPFLHSFFPKPPKGPLLCPFPFSPTTRCASQPPPLPPLLTPSAPPSSAASALSSSPTTPPGACTSAENPTSWSPAALTPPGAHLHLPLPSHLGRSASATSSTTLSVFFFFPNYSESVIFLDFLVSIFFLSGFLIWVYGFSPFKGISVGTLSSWALNSPLWALQFDVKRPIPTVKPKQPVRFFSFFFYNFIFAIMVEYLGYAWFQNHQPDLKRWIPTVVLSHKTLFTALCFIGFASVVIWQRSMHWWWTRCLLWCPIESMSSLVS